MATVHRWLQKFSEASRLRKLLIVCLYFLAVWTTILVLVGSTPIYEGNAIVSIERAPIHIDDGSKSSAQRPEQVALPYVVLLQSENVIKTAVEAVGTDNLYPGKSSLPRYVLERALDIAGKALKPFGIEVREPQGEPYAGPFRVFKPLPAADAAFFSAAKALNVRPEPQTDLIRVSFRHDDPRLAAEFVNALIQSFTERYFTLFSNARVVSFFWEQQKKSDQEFGRASELLSKYASNNQIYVIEEQRRLLLARRNSLAQALVATSGETAQKESESAAIPSLLAQMKPIGRLPQINGLLQRNRGDGATAGVGEQAARDPAVDRLAADPPLLLVRVYQDTVATLVRLNTELAGLRALAATQQVALKATEAELANLSARQSEFEQLQLKVAQAKQSAVMFRKKALEEQLSREVNATNLSKVQIIQEATVPRKPVWPNVRLLLAVGLLLCLAPFVIVPLLGYALRAAHVENELVRPISWPPIPVRTPAVEAGLTAPRAPGAAAASETARRVS